MEFVVPIVVAAVGALFIIVFVALVGGTVYHLWRGGLQADVAADGEHAIMAERQVHRVSPRHHGMALVSIITGGDDYGTWPPDAPRSMLASAWGIHDERSAVRTIDRFLHTHKSADDLVFDRVRAAHIARAAAGAEYITQAQSWDYVRRASQDVQRAFPNWASVGEAYLRAKNRWLSEQGYPTADGTEQKVQSLRGGIWQGVPFDLNLG